MIRTPHEPDNGLFLPLGHPEPKGKPKANVAPPYTEYTPIKGRPGWEDDGYGHLRYDGTAEARKREAQKDGEKKIKDVAALAEKLTALQRDNPAAYEQGLQRLLANPNVSAEIKSRMWGQRHDVPLYQRKASEVSPPHVWTHKT